MPRLMVPILACALGVAAAFALVSCGDSGSDEGLLPGKTASQIVENIDRAQTALADEDCSEVLDKANAIVQQVDELPTTVEPDLRTSLSDGAASLQDKAANGCGLDTTESETTTTTTTEDTDTVDTQDTTDTQDTIDTGETTTKDTTSTPTTPTEPTTTTTPTTVPTTPTTPTTTPTPPPVPPNTGGGIGPAGRAVGN